jgi:aryl-alcohol dehydrogenase-like predicted oxidoreductase
MPYGVTNAAGRIDASECAEILSVARANGIDTLDTAIAYGDSEAVLGSIGVEGLRIVTKLPALPADVANVAGWVDRMVSESLLRLRADRLHAVLLHRPAQLLESKGDVLYNALTDLKTRGLATGVGISIYGPEELEAIARRYPFDLVQTPLNVLDRRLEGSGWLRELAEAGVEVHVRSVFLQGLLVARQLPSAFTRWRDLWRRWSAWTEAAGVTKVHACLQFALSKQGVERVVVGVDSADQLSQIVAAAAAPCTLPPDDLSTADMNLIDPSRWDDLVRSGMRTTPSPIH